MAQIRKWLMLGLLSTMSFFNAATLLTFTSVSEETARYYKVNIIFVNALVSISDGLSLFAVFIVPYLVDRSGVKGTIAVIHILNIAGSFIRLAGCFPGKGWFALLLVGQGLCALASYTTTQYTPRLALKWFPPTQRALVIACQNIFWQFGVLFGVLLGSSLIHHMKILLLIQAVTNVPSAIAIFVTKNEPPEPPNTTEANQAKSDSIGFKEAAFMLLHNKYWLYMAIAFGFSTGTVTAWLSLMEQLLPNSLAHTAALQEGLFMGFGMLGALISALLADSTRKYFQITTWLAVMMFFSLCLFAFGIAKEDFSLITFGSSCSGFGSFGLAPVVTEYLIELSYTPGVFLEARSTAYSWLIANLVTVIFTLVCVPAIMSRTASLSIFVCVIAISGIFILLLHEAPLRRLDAEKSNEETTTLASPPSKVSIQDTQQPNKQISQRRVGLLDSTVQIWTSGPASKKEDYGTQGSQVVSHLSTG